MKSAVYLITALALTGCASSPYAQRRNLAVKVLQYDWTACIDRVSWEWLGYDRNNALSEDEKKVREKMTNGQMFVHVLDQCRDHLDSKQFERWDGLKQSEIKRFIGIAQKRFNQIGADIQYQRDLETI